MVKLHRKLLRDLVHIRGQVLAIALVVASAVSTYVTMRGAYESLLFSQHAYYESCRFADLFASLVRAPEPVAQRLREIPGVAAIQTRVVAAVVLDVPRLDEPASALIVSLPDEGEPRLNAVHVRSGRMPLAADEVLISEAFAAANELTAGATVDAVIRSRWQTLRVCGIGITPEYVNEARGISFPDHRRFGVMWMRRRHLAAAMGMQGAFNDVAIALAPGASEPGVIAGVDRLLARYGGLGAYGRNEQTSHRFLRDELAQDRITSLVIPGIFLAVAALLIHLLLTRLVASQREQIAVLKAFGYADRAIARHFAGFGVAIVALGALAGVPLGIWLGQALTRLYTKFFHFPELTFRVSGAAIAISVGITLVSALAGSLSAVRRVVALPPAEGMRGETPVVFGRGLLDRTRFIRAVSPPLRMIVRSLQRTPLRTAMSIAAMATAGMILVVGQFTFDALDSIIDTQFRAAQSDDATIELHEVRGDDAVHAIARLPGVIRVEPQRVVPVRIRSGHRERRTALIGLERDATMRRLVNMEGRQQPLPAQGLVLTRKLAEILEVREGDDVIVEAMTAPRPVARMRVAALLDESIGLGAYTARENVNRFMREGPSLSSAALAVEPAQAAKLYATLKAMPGVAAVPLREVMLASFRKTVLENIYMSASMVVAFACVIAFGVIYNGARIALSERGRDLASLRVLGFSKREAGAMLLGEQAILTLVSIPIGFLGGWAICLWIAHLFDSEVYRLPLVISARTYALSFLVIALAASFTAVVVQRRIGRLDLVEVLKTRE
ncbi:MAG TPA: FtsX-like permease family protein [Thermoanaerobaculia bacterium]|nr:FtsX-like permease family protein [Thermoanaerobaculia bacterium]